jgi:hypothetical protein
MTIYFDIDGVLRDLCGAVGIEPEKYSCTIQGEAFTEYFNRNKHLLRLAKPTPYLEVAKAFHKYIGISILTNQPHDWRPYTLQWLYEYFGKPRPAMTYAEDDLKQAYLNDDSILIEDNPKFALLPQVILIAQPYNRFIKCTERVGTPEALFRAICRRIK